MPSELMLVPAVLVLVGLGYWAVRTRVELATQWRWVLASNLGLLASSVAITLILSRRPSGAWRLDLVLPLFGLFGVFLVELNLVDQVVRRLPAGGDTWWVSVGLQLIVGPVVLFATMLLLMLVYPS